MGRRSIQLDLLCGPTSPRSGQDEGAEMDQLQAAGLPAMNLVDIGRRLLGVGTHYTHYSLYSRYRQAMACEGNCSGHGQCLNGSCYCMIQYEGSLCDDSNFAFMLEGLQSNDTEDALFSHFCRLQFTSDLLCLTSAGLQHVCKSHVSILSSSTNRLLSCCLFLGRGVPP